MKRGSGGCEIIREESRRFCSREYARFTTRGIRNCYRALDAATANMVRGRKRRVTLFLERIMRQTIIKNRSFSFTLFAEHQRYLNKRQDTSNKRSSRQLIVSRSPNNLESDRPICLIAREPVLNCAIRLTVTFRRECTHLTRAARVCAIHGITRHHPRASPPPFAPRARLTFRSRDISSGRRNVDKLWGCTREGWKSLCDRGRKR